MVRIEDLRLGNCVMVDRVDATVSLANYMNFFLKVESINYDECALSNGLIALPFPVRAIHGVPLSDTILLMFGFTRGEAAHYYTFTRENIMLYVGSQGYEFRFDAHPHAIGVKYVHELQNLWLTITGSPLIYETKQPLKEERVCQ